VLRGITPIDFKELVAVNPMRAPDLYAASARLAFLSVRKGLFFTCADLNPCGLFRHVFILHRKLNL
jgi:hypothetical protein